MESGNVRAQSLCLPLYIEEIAKRAVKRDSPFSTQEIGTDNKLPVCASRYMRHDRYTRRAVGNPPIETTPISSWGKPFAVRALQPMTAEQRGQQLVMNGLRYLIFR